MNRTTLTQCNIIIEGVWSVNYGKTKVSLRTMNIQTQSLTCFRIQKIHRMMHSASAGGRGWGWQAGCMPVPRWWRVDVTSLTHLYEKAIIVSIFLSWALGPRPVPHRYPYPVPVKRVGGRTFCVCTVRRGSCFSIVASTLFKSPGSLFVYLLKQAASQNDSTPPPH